jgi:hypothetical protein
LKERVDQMSSDRSKRIKEIKKIERKKEENIEKYRI